METCEGVVMRGVVMETCKGCMWLYLYPHEGCGHGDM